MKTEFRDICESKICDICESKLTKKESEILDRIDSFECSCSAAKKIIKLQNEIKKLKKIKVR